MGLPALVYWLASVAGGEQSYAAAARLFASPLGLAALIGWTFAFLYHLLNGVRHLCWDAGYGFERTQRHASGWFAVLGAIALTLVVWSLLRHVAS
jgi:succinate dehydrogenase / fumarate reductase cytochrome b subunit